MQLRVLSGSKGQRVSERLLNSAFWSLGLGGTQEDVFGVQPGSLERQQTSLTASKSWSSAYFQKTLLKSIRGARILPQGDAGNRTAEWRLEGIAGLSRGRFLLRPIWLFLRSGHPQRQISLSKPSEDFLPGHFSGNQTMSTAAPVVLV